MLMLNPNTGKPVDVSAEFVDRFVRAGFKEQKPEVVEPEKVAAPRAKRTPRKPRT